MKNKSIIITATVSALLIWVGLVEKSRSIKIDDHAYYRAHLVEQHQHDLAVNQIVLETRYSLKVSYENLSQELQQIKKVYKRLQNIPDFLDDQNTQKLQSILTEGAQSLDQRLFLLEEFKAKNGLLKNSLYHLTFLIDQTKQDKTSSDQLDQVLTELFDKALLYTLNSDEAIAPEVQLKVEELQAYINSDAAKENPNLEDVLAYVQNILDHKPQVDRLTQDLLALPIKQQTRDLSKTYETAYETAVQSSKLFQLAATIWFISMLGGAIYLILTMDQFRKAEQMARTLFEGIDDGFVSVNHQWNITYVNVQAAKTLGKRPDEIVGQSFWTTFPHELGHNLTDYYQQAINQQTVVKFEVEYRKLLWLEFRLYPRKDDLAVFWQDISIRKQAEAQLALSLKITDKALNKAKDECKKAKEANHAKSQFLANMSHELRTPLNAIIGYSELLQEDAADIGQDIFLPELQKIQGAGKHLLSLINNVLDLSKVESGCMEMHLEKFDIMPLLQNVISTMQPLIENNNNILRLQCAEDIGTIYADQVKVRQSLFNLLSNASKFTQGGVITLRAFFTNNHGVSWIHFQVQDTGIGMTPSQLKKIFEAFSQADSSTTRKYGGTGLGLTITKKFIEMMEGEITVESKIGKGTTFSILIPQMVQTFSISSDMSAEAHPLPLPSQPSDLDMDMVRTAEPALNHVTLAHNCVAADVMSA
ncbi:DAHL domain-containing protein [Leptothoe sp. PORK10 BA2]|uniref:DAHL domain-containing protein n=1 Tax=Leptothoe sp. PORK10 BA2 TaxID=3110254 RepID=UPI002B20D545|nr:DAHL domain-containing protein [Leptothoe sp. PORK10 BA2]MEA5464930.1 DAHL domain-containing protein [Leptothoe sp. PORK10 BA2]